MQVNDFTLTRKFIPLPADIFPTTQVANPPGEQTDVIMTGMLAVSLRGANHGFWSHLECSGRTSHICICQVSWVGIAREELKTTGILC